MSKQTRLEDGWGRANKCGGIPIYPAEYKFHMEEPVEFTEEQIKARKERLSKFLEKHGLKF